MRYETESDVDDDEEPFNENRPVRCSECEKPAGATPENNDVMKRQVGTSERDLCRDCWVSVMGDRFRNTTQEDATEPPQSPQIGEF